MEEEGRPGGEATEGGDGVAPAPEPKDEGGDSLAASIEGEIRSLAAETSASTSSLWTDAPPKSVDETLAAYAGREGELLERFRALKRKLAEFEAAESNEEKKRHQEEIVALIATTNPSRPAEEVLAELLRHLRAAAARSDDDDVAAAAVAAAARGRWGGDDEDEGVMK
ncbi:hypothetical protein ACHAWF_011845, partial [Thalassiosira exigua]